MYFQHRRYAFGSKVMGSSREAQVTDWDEVGGTGAVQFMIWGVHGARSAQHVCECAHELLTIKSHVSSCGRAVQALLALSVGSVLFVRRVP